MTTIPLNKYAFIATHGVGKTATASYMDFYFRQMSQIPELIPEVAREAKAKGLPINEKTTLRAQEAMQYLQRGHEISAQERLLNGEIQHIICDRAVIDNYVYALYKFGQKAKDKMYDSVMQWMQENPYKNIFKIPLWNEDKELTDDGVRSLNKQFQIDIDTLLDDVLEESGIKYNIIPRGIYTIDTNANPDLQTANLRSYFDDELGIIRIPKKNKNNRF